MRWIRGGGLVPDDKTLECDGGRETGVLLQRRDMVNQPEGVSMRERERFIKNQKKDGRE